EAGDAGVLSLLVEVAFRLHLARLQERHRRRFELLLAFTLRRHLRRLLRPFRRRVEIEVAAGDVAVQTIERDEIEVPVLADAVGAELPWTIGNRLEPVGGIAGPGGGAPGDTDPTRVRRASP